MRISNLHVMQSAAGFYVGCTYLDEKLGGDFPYSRNSQYFPTRALAEDYLDWIIDTNPDHELFAAKEPVTAPEEAIELNEAGQATEEMMQAASEMLLDGGAWANPPGMTGADTEQETIEGAVPGHYGEQGDMHPLPDPHELVNEADNLITEGRKIGDPNKVIEGLEDKLEATALAYGTTLTETLSTLKTTIDELNLYKELTDQYDLLLAKQRDVIHALENARALS